MEQPVLEAIRATLLSDASIATAVGERVYGQRPRQSAATPYIVIRGPSTEWTQLAASYSMTRGTTAFEISVSTPRPEQTRALAKLMREAINSLRGEFAGVKIGGLTVERQEVEPYQPSPPGQENGIYRTTLFGDVAFTLSEG